MKKEYIKPEVKEVVLDSEDLLQNLTIGSQENDKTPLSKGNSSFDNDSDWDD